jgi:hypothetical protein
MESSSSGNFHHYSDPVPPPQEDIVGSKPGSSGEIDTCDIPLPNVRLEEIAQSEYYSVTTGVPPVGTAVKVRRKLVGGRIAVETTSQQQSIGFLPTQHNYLLACLESGRKYKGKVTASAASPVPRVVIDLAPI